MRFRIFMTRATFTTTSCRSRWSEEFRLRWRWLWFVIAYLVFLFRMILRARKTDRFAASVATGVLASFVALQLTSIVHYNLGIESVAMTLYFYFGLAIALDRILQRSDAIDVP